MREADFQPYVVCAVQRSGSFLLCEALKLTGLAGHPEEYLLEWEDGVWARSRGVSSRREFVELVRREGTTPNGVFGLKLMWNYFGEVVGKLRELPGCASLAPSELLARVFPRLKYLWITRREKVRQAVSWAIAAQTGVYAASQEALRAAESPRFDFDQIDQLHQLILEGEERWRRHFAAAGVDPLHVVYEELVADYAGTALRALDYLGVPYPVPLVFGERQMRRQATALNDEWVERYLQERAARA